MITGPPDDYTRHLKTAAHEALSMTDIERLRTRYDSATDQAVKYADEIERLRAALQEIAALDVHHKDDNGTWTDVGKIARRALESKP